MFRIAEYRATADRLMDHLPWAGFIAAGVILNKDGSFQKSLTFRGPDLASATKSGLMAARAQLNNALRRLGSQWCVHVEALRAASQTYPDSEFPDPVSGLIDEERRGAFEAENAHFESRYFITFTFLPPEENIGRASSLVIENAPVNQGADTLYQNALRDFQNVVRQVGDILASFMPEVREMNDDETLTYLHSCVSTKRHPVKAPETPFYLDAMITDDDFQAGLFPKLGRHYIRTISIRAYPHNFVPGILDQLNSLGLSYRWVCRYLPMDKEDARKELERIRKRWFAKRKGIATMIKEAMTKEPSALEDSDAVAKAMDAEAAMLELGSDAAGMGYFTPTITLMDLDPDRLAAKVREVESVINRAGFVAKIEDVNAVEAWLGSLPGHAYADVRRPMVTTLALCDMLPISANWSGPVINKHLTSEARKRGVMAPQPPLLHARTDGSTPFRFDLHQGDVGHTMIIGPTGAGKSVLLNTIAMQWLRYPDAQVFIFDKGASSRASTMLVGGSFFHLGGERATLAFQPLAEIDTASDIQWAHEWVLDILTAENVSITPLVKDAVWSALINLAEAPPHQRTLTMLTASIQDIGVKEALKPYTLEGPYGHLLDSDENTLGLANWQAFEMEALMETKGAVGPVLMYLFHMLEKRRFANGHPTLLVLDEAWLFLNSGSFSNRIETWLRTLRKKNVAVVFATQSLNDVLNSPIMSALVESCPTRVFLSNPDALSPQISKLYRLFGMNDTQIDVISKAIPKREYYYQSRAGNRLFELGLGQIALAAVASSSSGDHKIMDEIEMSGDDFAPAFYAAKGLPNVAHHLQGWRAAA
jgi:type IV secretion system protein VirB4